MRILKKKFFSFYYIFGSCVLLYNMINHVLRCPENFIFLFAESWGPCSNYQHSNYYQAFHASDQSSTTRGRCPCQIRWKYPTLPLNDEIIFTARERERKKMGFASWRIAEVGSSGIGKWWEIWKERTSGSQGSLACTAWKTRKKMEMETEG